eukprot:766761-Hanusia_phi.AAC.6
MKLAEEKLNELAEERGFLDQHGIKILGDLEVLPQHVKVAACRAMKISEHHKQAVLNICIAYTSREVSCMPRRKTQGGVGKGGGDKSEKMGRWKSRGLSKEMGRKRRRGRRRRRRRKRRRGRRRRRRRRILMCCHAGDAEGCSQHG